MSSSPSRVVSASASSSNSVERTDVLPFAYHEVISARADENHSLPRADDGGAAATRREDREAQVREQGRQQGLAEARKSFEEQLAHERSALAKTVAEFTRERADYFTRVEAEVVQLALGIARKILHREAQIDPLLLAGIVRVALEKIQGATGVILEVHPQQAADWKRYLALHMDPVDLPEIVEDPSLEPDRCRLRTAMGTADLGTEVQLKEIERGLADLLAARPGATP